MGALKMDVNKIAVAYTLDPEIVNVIKKQSNPKNSFNLAKKIAGLIVEEAKENKYSNADILSSLYYLIFMYHKMQIEKVIEEKADDM